jgi:hypothetical protein
MRTLDAFELLRDSEDGWMAGSGAAERLSALAERSLKGEPKGLRIAVRLDFDFGDSKRPYRGRGGRSGVTLPLPDSDTDAERDMATGVFGSW